MDEKKNNIYTTSDLYLAALLYCKEKKFLGLEDHNLVNPGYYLFTFQDFTGCETIVDDFFARNIQIDCKTYIDSIRTMRDILTNAKRRGLAVGKGLTRDG